MLRSLLFSVSLEGLEPGRRPPRAPLPIVWVDRVPSARGRRRLHELAATLGRDGVPAGWQSVCFTQGAALPASRTVA